MYGQSCRVVGRGGVGHLQFGGASLCWGRSVTTHTQRSVEIPQVRWVRLVRQYIALPRPWLPLRMESSVSRAPVERYRVPAGTWWVLGLLWERRSHKHDHKTCKVYEEEKRAYFQAHPEKVP